MVPATVQLLWFSASAAAAPANSRTTRSEASKRPRKSRFLWVTNRPLKELRMLFTCHHITTDQDAVEKSAV